MSKNILLINPWIHDFAAYDLWLKPLGLLYLGGLLRQNGHQVHFIDCLDPYHPVMLREGHKQPQRHTYGRGKFFRQVIPKPDSLKMIPKNYCRYGITPEIFRQELNKHQDTDIFLVTSMMTYWYPGVFEAIKIIKEVLPKIPIVLGGKYATLCYEHAVKYSGADFVISGAGEKQILNLLQDVSGEKISFMPDEEKLDSYPYPAFDLIRKIDQLPITTSRGCPYRCSYCCSYILNKKFLRRDPINVADEIEYWHNKFGVKKALLTTAHSYTATQSLVDGPAAKDFRRGRAAAANIAPSTTGAAIATTLTIPSLKGKFDGISIRVPSICGSLIDVTAVLKKKVTVEQVNKAFEDASKNPLWKGIVMVSKDQLVSTDILGTTYSAIVEPEFTKVIDGDLVKVIAWYDNEYGYSCRLVEMVEKM